MFEMLVRFSALLLHFVALQTAAQHSVWDWHTTWPPTRESDGPFTPSAAANGPSDAVEYAFSCPHMCLLSDDMVLAAASDGFALANVLYAVAGGPSDADCGVCYAVQILDAERQWRDDFPILVVMVINSGGDVMAGQLDVMIGAGGAGYFDACHRDCATKTCPGGACHDYLYEGTFDAWNDAEYSDPHDCSNGGMKWLREANGTILHEKCEALVGKPDRAAWKLKDYILVDSCVRTNQELLHQNFVSCRRTRVACPPGLVRITGLRRRDDAAFPDITTSTSIDPSVLTEVIQGSRSEGHFALTTMQDCAVPSCSWAGKVDADPMYKRVDRCDRGGRVMA